MFAFKKLVFLIICLFFLLNSLGQTNKNHVRVKAYYKSDGTYVPSHYRTAPNSSNRDNFSTLGNTNPYTGKKGHIPPDSKPLYKSNYNTKRTSSFYNSNPNYSDKKRKENNISYTTNTSYSNNVKGTLVFNSDGKVRSTDSPFSQVIGYMNKGDKLNFVSNKGGYYQVDYKGRTGYVSEVYTKVYSYQYSNNNSTSKSYVQKRKENNMSYTTNTSYSKNVKGTLVFNSDGKVRSTDSPFSQVIGYMNKGDKLNFVSNKGGYYQVDYKGRTGYVSEVYTKVYSYQYSNNNSTSKSYVQKRKENNMSYTTNTSYSNNVKGTLVFNSDGKVRSTDSPFSQVIGYMNKGDKLNFVSNKGGYYQVDYKGRTGYVSEVYTKVYSYQYSNNNSTSKSYVQKRKENNMSYTTNTSYSNNVKGTLVFNSDGKVRSTDSPFSQVIGYMNKGDKLNFVSNKGGYYQVDYKGRTGYVSEVYTKVYSYQYSNNNSTSKSYVQKRKENKSKERLTNNTSIEVIQNRPMIGVITMRTKALIRMKPNLDSDLIGSLSKNSQIGYSEILPNGYYKVYFNNKVGYIHKIHIDLEKSKK
ncbi:SH3 domain-containing protein [Maribacter sp. 1_2014MBL_MicDiv]|uniref:SH3 domain-containing protein n=1 Tax=Maribacter sp. 1_2014MBL_MicDiv TaxID=1644130 RepID=UPI0008F4E65F|nr:SH3 domain-containing protein [Maribacter sp. 1_2014MBL_MicDiv]APA65644.1 hypothetical protein YQ22_15780 [Maribacter sp. 1_2014MBL_MicDiv]